MLIYYPAKKVIERGKAGDFRGKSFFLPAILTLPNDPHTFFTLHLEKWIDCLSQNYTL